MLLHCGLHHFPRFGEGRACVLRMQRLSEESVPRCLHGRLEMRPVQQVFRGSRTDFQLASQNSGHDRVHLRGFLCRESAKHFPRAPGGGMPVTAGVVQPPKVARAVRPAQPSEVPDSREGKAKLVLGRGQNQVQRREDFSSIILYLQCRPIEEIKVPSTLILN